MNRFCTALAALAVSLPAYAQAPAQQKPSTADTSESRVTPETKQFVEKAAIGDMYEIQSSRIVQDKLQNKEFQDFGQRIVKDHSKSSDELKPIVQGMRDVQMPTQLDNKHKGMIEQLRSATGADLARQYKSQQIQAHQDAVRLYEDYSNQGDNTKLKQFASATLPKLKEHLRMAQGLPDNPQVAGGQRGGQQAAGGTAANQRQQGAQQQTTQSQAQQPTQVISQLASNHILGSRLRGTNVYGANDADVGEINDLVLTTDGQIAAVIVGVGGFLGVGEKDVAIPFSDIEIRRSAATTGMANQDQQKADGQPQRVYLRGMTKQELEQAPSFKTGATGTNTGSK